MAQHEVSFEVPKRTLENEDVVFEVRRDGAKFGVLLISKGDIAWIPAGKQYQRYVSWKDFDEFMQSKKQRPGS